MSCPSFEDLVEARLSPDSRPEVLTHLGGGCANCVQRLKVVEIAVSALRAEPFPAVPERLHRLALEIPDRVRRGPLREALAGVVEFVGELVFDSRAARPALALRGEHVAERHLLYRAGPFEIDVALLEDDALVGQVLHADADLGDDAACVLCGEDRVLQSSVEPNGDFHFDAVPPGRYMLMFESGELRVVVPEVDLDLPHPEHDGGHGVDA